MTELRTSLAKLDELLNQVSELTENIDHDPEGIADHWADLYDDIASLQATITECQEKENWI